MGALARLRSHRRGPRDRDPSGPRPCADPGARDAQPLVRYTLDGPPAPLLLPGPERPRLFRNAGGPRESKVCVLWSSATAYGSAEEESAMMTHLIAVAGLTGCFQSPRQQTEEAREEAADVMEEARDVQQAEGPEEQVDLAEAREDLVAEIREMATVLENYQNQDMTPEAEQQLAQLQQRYLELARRIESAGAEPDVIRELQDVYEELDRDVQTYGRDIGT
jgi:hypothetical protein